MTFKDMNNSYPVHMAKYEVNKCTAGKPALAWWIRHGMAKLNHIIGKLKSKYWV